MKYKFLITFLLLFISNIFAQTSNDKIIYLDSLDIPVNETNYHHKRVIKDYYIDKDKYKVEDYYKSGSLKKIGITYNKNNVYFEGQIKTYYENGNIKSLVNHEPSIEIHKVFQWYENGNKKSETEHYYNHKEILITRFLQYWDKNNIQKLVNGNGEYEEDDEYNYAKGNCVNGKKNGVWIGKAKIFNFSYTENYVNGKRKSGTSIDSNNMKHNYKVLFKESEPKKGYESLIRKISKFGAQYQNGDSPPDIPNRYISISIDANGRAVIRSITGIENESEKNELIEILNEYKEWNPYIYRGIPVPDTYIYRIPVRFSTYMNNIINSRPSSQQK